jgi:hypothetical protein
VTLPVLGPVEASSDQLLNLAKVGARMRYINSGNVGHTGEVEMDAPSQWVVSRKPVLALALGAFAAGGAGMAVSFQFLASPNEMDVRAGAGGFVAGAVLVAAGLLAIAILSRPNPESDTSIRLVGCALLLGPPAVAAASGPVLYFGFFFGSIILFPLVILGCLVWAWPVSEAVAVDLSAVFGWGGTASGRPYPILLRLGLLGFEAVAVLASLPLLGALLNWLESLGYKVGWS